MGFFVCLFLKGVMVLFFEGFFWGCGGWFFFVVFLCVFLC